MNKTEQITDIIRYRRSIFPASYNGKEIPKEAVEHILANANYAPNHKQTEPWRFCVFRGDSLQQLGNELASLYKAHTAPEKFMQQKFDSMANKVMQSSCVIAINIQLHPDKLPEWEELAAVACAVQNMWLTASSMNIGAYWSTPGMIRHMNTFLGLGENEKCIGLFYMGNHDEEPREGKRGDISEKVTWRE